MRRIVVLATVAVALATALALNGTSVLSRLSTQEGSPTPTVTTIPTGTPESTPAKTPSRTPTPRAQPTGTDRPAPLPGTVLTARPAPRRCPSPPCVP